MTAGISGGIGIGGFTCVPGDLTRRAEDIAGFDARWHALLPDTAFEKMGCGTFSAMSRPVVEHVTDCVTAVLADRGLAPEDVNRLVVATSDACLERLDADVAVQVLAATGMTRCVPTLLSHLQCCSSLEALRYGWQLFDDPAIEHVVVVAVDFTPDDLDRVRSFAVFGDAAAGCLISRTPGPGSVELLASATTVDHAGLLGEDSFRSRQQAATSALDTVFARTGEQLQKVAKVFGSNLYVPVATFNAMAAGVPRGQLHFQETMQRHGHCGNADWILNLVDHAAGAPLGPGELYVALSSAPGFFACTLLRGL
ncbi:MAG: hypothetical protein LH603_06215 [Pseudonocardia sp.]|nr:hypothetical protein [Pseudonocardia sp.]